MAHFQPKSPVAGFGVFGMTSKLTLLEEARRYPFGSLASLPPAGPYVSPVANALASVIAPTEPTAPNFPTSLMWNHVRRRFNRFLAYLEITDLQQQEGETKIAGITACLNRWYYDHSSETANAIVIGSWGKGTRNRPSSDVDLLYLLPVSEFIRFEQRTGNKQSALLQDVKQVLFDTYSTTTTMRGDGQVIVLPFNGIPVEVVPGFLCPDGSILTCDTNDGGRYALSTAKAEAVDIAYSDIRWRGNTRALARMAKQWKRENNVPLKSFKIERLAIEFLDRWSYSEKDVFYYDWMTRDFFEYLIGRANTILTMPGSEKIWLGDEWLSRAQTAYRRAVEACISEKYSLDEEAGQEWQKVFGVAIPVKVS